MRCGDEYLTIYCDDDDTDQPDIKAELALSKDMDDLIGDKRKKPKDGEDSEEEAYQLWRRQRKWEDRYRAEEHKQSQHRDAPASSSQDVTWSQNQKGQGGRGKGKGAQHDGKPWEAGGKAGKDGGKGGKWKGDQKGGKGWPRYRGRRGGWRWQHQDQEDKSAAAVSSGMAAIAPLMAALNCATFGCTKQSAIAK